MRRMRKVFDRREKGPEGNPGPRVLRAFGILAPKSSSSSSWPLDPESPDAPVCL